MAESEIPKDVINNLGRTFALIFNRATMYNIEHPSTQQALDEYYKYLSSALNHSTPIVVILNKEEFYIEDEPFDPRLNTSRMLQHFKRTGLESLSFESGVQKDELKTFMAVFVDNLTYTDADAMKAAGTEQGVQHIKINHVFYTKVTADDEVVDRKELENRKPDDEKGPAEAILGEALETMVGSVLSGEVKRSLSIPGIMNNPVAASQKLLEADLSVAQSGKTGAPGAGVLIAQQVQNIRQEVEQAAGDPQNADLQQLAEAVYDMKRNLLQGLETSKASGVVFQNEEQIRNETDEMTDNVLLQLIKKEYQKGKISTERLAHVLRRLIPEPGELQRLLPKIKETLLAEGMPLAEFLQLTVELKRELKSEELAHVLEKSAEDFGVSGDNLIDEIRRNPKGAAELIYLASEIRKGTGDEEVMSELLVDYIERIGSKITIDAAQKKGDDGGKQLRSIIASVENALLKGLKNKDVKADVIHQVAQRLNDRMEQCIEKIESQWFTLQSKSYGGEGSEDPTTVLGLYEKDVEDKSKIKRIFDQVKDSIDDDSQTPQHSKSPAKGDSQKLTNAEKVGIPDGIFDRRHILAYVEKEIARAMRYDTPFSVLVMSVLKIKPRIEMEIEEKFEQAAFAHLLQTLLDLFRASDIVGVLDQDRVLIILPMTINQEARLAIRRVIRAIHEKEFVVEDIPLKIQLAGSATTFDQDRTPSLDKFVKRAETDSSEMERRLRNIHGIF